jgi:hypothetical protein
MTCACTLAAPPAQAQTKSRPSITVAATLDAAAAGRSPLLILVGPPSALPRGSFLRVRGLPPTAALSAGYSIAPGAWAVPLAALADLKITLPADVRGRAEISIVLVASDGSVLAEARSSLMVAAPAAPATILRAGTPLPKGGEREPPAPLAAPRVIAVPMTAAERERALRLVKRGDEQLAQGGIAQARLLYERAAEAGLAQGAMALAATYDPAELRRLDVLGLQPDLAAARKWYERARQLGSVEAGQRLQRLGAN